MTTELSLSIWYRSSESDTYTCPQGQTLTTKGTWHQKKRDLNMSYQFKKYRTPSCTSCPVKDLCTGRKDGRREIERSVFALAVEQNAKDYQSNQALYRKRQEINEHIFGTIKRHGPTSRWGYDHTNLRGLSKVNGEMALIMTVYNIKRSLNILGLIEKLHNWSPDYAKANYFGKKRPILSLYVSAKENDWKLLENSISQKAPKCFLRQ
ncbi:transposase [Flectobacillus longus]|uniref:transposase n=1 Tax=Flectobacillus longus TaxID=2984207 RepID=UPI0024B7F8E5|nr:transposase [Flectobacillus longus]MDI9882674.1 transposase [Flectobacillus longus]